MIDYEILLLLDPDLAEEPQAEVVTRVRDLVEKMLKSSGRRVDLSTPFVDAMASKSLILAVLDESTRGTADAMCAELLDTNESNKTTLANVTLGGRTVLAWLRG